MKVLALVFLLFGIAAAVSYEDVERAKDEAISSFMLEMEQALSLQEAMNMGLQELNEVEEEIQTELVKALRDALNTLLVRMKEAVDHGKKVTEEMKEHVEKIKGELRKLHQKIGDKAKELLERIVEKTKGKLKEWGKKILGIEYSKAYEVALAESKLRESLKKLREKLEEKGRDLAQIAEYIKEQFKDHAEVARLLLKNLKEESVEKLKNIIDKILGKNKDRRDLKEIRDYLKEAHKDLEHRSSNFLDWLEKVYKTVFDASKGRLENVKKVAQKFLEHVKEVGKKTADEAMEFFRPYKDDLGTLWHELEEAIKEAYGKH